MSVEAVVAICSFLCTVTWALVIRPLQQAINDLRELILSLRDDIKEESERRASIEIRLCIVEEKIERIKEAVDNGH